MPCHAERAAGRWIVSSDPDEHVERIRPYLDLGFTHLIFHAPGPDQRRFLRAVLARGASAPARPCHPGRRRLSPASSPGCVGPLRSTVMRSEHAPLPGHGLAILLPVGMLPADAAVVVDEQLHRFGQAEDLDAALELCQAPKKPSLSTQNAARGLRRRLCAFIAPRGC